MKINANSNRPSVYSNNSSAQSHLSHKSRLYNNPSFKMSLDNGFEMSKKLKASLYIQKMLAKIVGQESNVKYYELGLLEGIQDGIDVFKGLNLKQIAFLCEDMHTVMSKRGCFSHCAYCYSDAQTPIKKTQSSINSILFEDFKAFTEGIKTLKKRSGINFVHNNSDTPYQTLVFDADNIDVAVNDLKGNTHEFPELNRLLYETTGIGGIFDTTGWNISSEKYQKRAERIVQYYADPKNMKELFQFNISINPFHSTLVKVNELKAKGNGELAERIYNKHIEKTANALFTYIPLYKSEKFGTINRAFGWNIPNMQGYYFTDELKILSDVFKKFAKMCNDDFKTNQKYIKSKEHLLDVFNVYANKLDQKGEVRNIKNINIDTGLIAAPKLEKFIRDRNPQMSYGDFCKIFKDVLRNNDSFSLMSEYKKYRTASLHYLKMIDSNGKVYLTDTHRVIPTDIQLNFINKDKQTQPFSTMVSDFVLTKKMI